MWPARDSVNTATLGHDHQLGLHVMPTHNKYS